MPTICIATTARPIIEVLSLAEELRHRGCEVSLVSQPVRLSGALDESVFSPYLSSDLLYYRSGLGEVLRIELGKRVEGIKVINRPYLTVPHQSSKLYQAMRVGGVGVRIPKTIVVSPQTAPYEFLVEELGLPFILKAANGIQGKQVHLINSAEELSGKWPLLSGDVLAQELIPNTGDYRVFVVGGTVFEIFKRVPAEGSFKANVSQGGRGEVVRDEVLRQELSRMAIAVASALELDITGVDIMQHRETGALYFIEANVNPGWKGLDQAVGCNTSAHIADWFLGQLT
jgi:RimK family alpha-L-glutamate ligase